MLVDSHCHLHLIDYEDLGQDMDQTVAQARDNSLQQMLCVSTNFDQTSTLLDIAETYPDVVVSIGTHPNEDPGVIDPEMVTKLVKAAQHTKVVAIGETGLDYYRQEDSQNISWQHTRFIQHIEAAKQLSKPLIIHTRAAKKDTIKILKDNQASQIGGVLHCFTEDWEMAQQGLDLNFLISFSGIVTFKNAIELQKVAKLVPLDKMLIETDCPYLAPTPHRGKINQPSYVKHVAEFIAQLRGISFEELAIATTENYYKLFGSK